jgi:hypothetical protein
MKLNCQNAGMVRTATTRIVGELTMEKEKAAKEKVAKEKAAKLAKA